MCHRFRLDERLSLARFRPAGEVLHQTALLAGCLPRLSHETHRGRVLCCPFATARLVRALPRLRLTADFSHWVVKSERLLDTPAEVELLREVIAPAVDHIHARIGTPQAPQVSDIGAMHCAGAAERHYSFWEDVWAARESASLSARDGEVRDLPPPRLVRPTNVFCTTRPPARPPIHPSAHRQRLKAQGSDVTTDDSETTVRPTCFAARQQAAGSRPPPPLHHSRCRSRQPSSMALLSLALPENIAATRPSIPTARLSRQHHTMRPWPRQLRGYVNVSQAGMQMQRSGATCSLD